jgi:ribosomal protein L7/L12
MEGELERIARTHASVEAALVALHDAGASPIGAIKALRAGKDLSLGEAKQALHASPAWYSEARTAEALHEQFLEALNEEDVESRDRQP